MSDFSHIQEAINELISQTGAVQGTDKVALISYISESVIGALSGIKTPFGVRPIVYADYTASGRLLTFIEEYLQKIVIPAYGNVHTSTSSVGLQSTLFREEARSIIHRCLRCSEEDCVLFVGNGSTGAINKLVGILQMTNWGLKKSCYRKNRWGGFNCTVCKLSFSTQGAYLNHISTHLHLKNTEEDTLRTAWNEIRPIVFVSIFEHHSNLLPWREMSAQVETIHENPNGGLDLRELREKLEKYKNYPVKIGSFSACSNITGILMNTKRIAALLHSYNAFAFFDFAACAPYIPINMSDGYDAVFISTHKFVGGPGTPGILAVKKHLLSNDKPEQPGGGTVYFVTEVDHNYLMNLEEREEGGTPNILGAIRAGLVFQLKEAVGEDLIFQIEERFTFKVIDRLRQIPNIALASDSPSRRIPIFSFMVKYQNKYFHSNFIAALFDDLFGIQLRAGCACAGPYGTKLLNISNEVAFKIRDAMGKGLELFKPGMVRFNLTYFYGDDLMNYLMDATAFIAENAIWFLPQYKFEMETAQIYHRKFASVEEKHKTMKRLGDIRYESGEMNYPEYTDFPVNDFKSYMDEAYKELEKIKSHKYADLDLEEDLEEIPSEYEYLRWFVLPSEALSYIQGQNTDLPSIAAPFSMKRYARSVPSRKNPGIPPLAPKPKRQRLNCPNIPKKLLKNVTTAINEFNMIEDGDRVLVCISGGEGSLSMLHILKHIQTVSSKRFEVAGVTVDPQVPEYDPSSLEEYMNKLQVPYFYESFPIVKLAADKITKKNTLTEICSKMKRGVLYSCARREGYNVIALGEHLDDLAENFLSSMFNNGVLRTMKASDKNDRGDIKIIRPLVYTPKKQTKGFAEIAQLPIIRENCPACFANPTERERSKQLLAVQEQLNPDLFSNIKKAIKSLMENQKEIRLPETAPPPKTASGIEDSADTVDSSRHRRSQRRADSNELSNC